MRISLIWHKTKYNYNSIKDKLMPASWTRTPNWFNHIYTKTAAEVGPSTHDKRYPGFGAIKEIYCKSDPAITTLIWVSSPKEDKSNQFSVWIAGVSEKYQIPILHFFFFFFSRHVQWNSFENYDWTNNTEKEKTCFLIFIFGLYCIFSSYC